MEEQAKYQAFPDCPERVHARSKELKRIQLRGIDDVMHVVFGASGGALLTEMTASQCMFQMVGAILENCRATNAVTSVLEHPSAFDAVKYYCEKTGKEFRVAQAQSQDRRHRPRGDPPRGGQGHLPAERHVRLPTSPVPSWTWRASSAPP